MDNGNTEIRFWGGLRTIGGTIISIEYEKARIVFDFGFIFSSGSNILDGDVRVRKSKQVADYLALGILPAIDGIYRGEDIQGINLLAKEQDERETVVLVSHMHLDHMGGAGMIDPDIPIYVTDDSLKLYETLEVVGEAVPGYTPNFRACTYGATFYVGHIAITPIAVDHDVIGACGFYIETPDVALFYTGDFRLHGNHPNMIEAAVEYVRSRGLDVLIMEGTTLHSVEDMKQPLVADPSLPKNMLREAEIVNRMLEICKQTDGLAFFNIYHRNIERLEALIQVAKVSNRKLIFELETAYIASRFLKGTDFSVYQSADVKQQRENSTLPIWMEQLLALYETVDKDLVNLHPNQFLLQISYENALELLDLNCENSVYLHANGMPLGDYDPNYQRLIDFLHKQGIPRYDVGTSGHAAPQHLKYVLERLKPSTFIPLHSFYPERLVPDHSRLFLPEYGVTYGIKQNKIVKKGLQVDEKSLH
ncbi:MBL fold metallo-hydrolase [Virgibacillus pantothenticus]|uniref:MBL fold metallo-hydrolase n=1 Tax=Virgibacillus TaxID=84406 RepID=UPI00090C7102|nr:MULTISPECIES: MBL fold metallo-hydrolase [Virgibacillus]API92058.1 hypothetical protein BKP57_09590 [Virgibacillus sp. 6R]MBS7430526.1 MBL fold metallo-hydrolase [Virgibacillus sp. 19R1-5]MBU8566464.1 MBL fold metallo-hydrolase [Virgibacillus pantothenticus]MBU8600121.1 MBL fold metallo-hydrolase [Virgibacillus pantothenticus]MBU8633947.1 MBL fold metallo-hydrolase [Virgibacillus pantothenticus]